MITPSEPKYGVHYHHIKLRAMMFETQIVDCQSTAFFMQYLAVLAAKKNVPTVLTNVAQRYKSTKRTFIKYSVNLFIIGGTDNISNPHETISYYLLSGR